MTELTPYDEKKVNDLLALMHQPKHLDFYILYHGTSSKYLKRIKREGLRKGSYLTNKENGAKYFAKYASERAGGKPIIIKYLIPETELSKAQYFGDIAGKMPSNVPYIESNGAILRFDKKIHGKVLIGDKEFKL